MIHKPGLLLRNLLVMDVPVEGPSFMHGNYFALTHVSAFT
jgi:hypothetical protein